MGPFCKLCSIVWALQTLSSPSAFLPLFPAFSIQLLCPALSLYRSSSLERLSWILWVFLCLHGISFIHASIQTVATSEILKPLILFEEMWTLLSFKFIPTLSTKGLTMAHLSYAFNWQWQVWGFFLPAIK